MSPERVHRRPGTEPRRLLVLGDTHGSTLWVGRAARVAHEMGLDAIVQVGDFGYLPNDCWYQEFVESCEHLLSSAGVPLWFVRGNHDDPDMLGRLVEQAPSDAIGAAIVSPHVRYIPCGIRWTWNDLRFGAIGGAFSVNRHELVEGTSWWRDEVVCPDGVDRLGRSQLDVLLAHEAPNDSTTVRDRYRDREDPFAEACAAQREAVSRAMRATCARVVVHGHHHVRYDEVVRWAATDMNRSDRPGPSTHLVGLACERWTSMMVLDTRDGSISDVPGEVRDTVESASDDHMLRRSQFEESRIAVAVG